MDTTAYHDLVLLRRYHLHGDQQARRELVERGLPLVRSLARRYRGKGELYDDLVQVGSVGLVKAIDRFDVHSRHLFVTFAVPNITGEIKRHFRDHTWSTHVPRGVQELDAKVQRARNDMCAVSGVTPSVAEIASHLEQPIERVEEAVYAGQSHSTKSLDHSRDDDRDLLSTIGGDDPDLDRVEARQLVRECSDVLDERERKVVWMRFFLDMLQREIAAEIGVSQMQVSRLLTRSLARMRLRAETRTVADEGAAPTGKGSAPVVDIGTRRRRRNRRRGDSRSSDRLSA